MRLKGGAVLDAVPEMVWAVISDWERQAEWIPDVRRIRVLSPERELGARLAVSTKVFGIPLTTDLVRVTGWDPPRGLTMIRRGFVRGTGRWQLEPDPRGTRFGWTEEIRIPIPVLGELLLRAYRPVMRRLMRRSLGNLAARVR